MPVANVVNKPARMPRSGASSETARQINRDIILQKIQIHQPVSRADLARLTGLQRSTVSMIISQLIEESWVIEGSLGRLPRGRRPTFVTLNEKHVTLGIDIRPTKANLAIVDINGKILARESVLFADVEGGTLDAKKSIAKTAKAAIALRKTYRDRLMAGVGICISGRVHLETHQLLFAPNAIWAKIDLHGELQRLLQTPIEMENAANANLLAQRWFGGFGDVRNMIIVSVSEGIGTGLLVDGRVVRGMSYMAGEFGHMPLEENGPVCGCGNTGCWEMFASNRAGLRYYKDLVPKSTLSSFQELLDLATGGDLQALRAIDKMTQYLARGLAMLIAGLAPEVIVVVGDCTALWSRIRPLIESHVISKAFTPRIPRIVAAADGDVARLRGAAALVLHKALFKHSEYGDLAHHDR
jgi:predicted NBD/HSP70 family sugar kinase